MFKTEVIAMNSFSKQRDYFYGAVGLLAVGALASVCAGSGFGFVAISVLIGLLCTRAQWARILTLVVAAYVGAVGALVTLFARGSVSFASFIAAFISAGVFWLLLRPGMDRFFGAIPKPLSQVVPVAPRPGALPHLHKTQAAPAFAKTTAAASNTQQQWERLQQQLRAEQEKEEFESAEVESRAHTEGFPWVALIVTVLVYAHAAAVGGPVGQFSLLIAIPGFIAAILRWIPLRPFLLAILLLSGGLTLAPEWNIVAPRLHALLQHQGPAIFAVLALLAYLIAMAIGGLENGEDHI